MLIEYESVVRVHDKNYDVVVCLDFDWSNNGFCYEIIKVCLLSNDEIDITPSIPKDRYDWLICKANEFARREFIEVHR